jgi:hypothetical protein
MNSKKKQKYGEDIKVPASSLYPYDKDGYMTKQGGSVKNWRTRYFILKDNKLYYYKTPKDQVFTGRIDLESGSVIKEEPGLKKSPNIFSIATQKRIFFMFPEKTEEVKSWIDALTKNVEKTKSTSPSNTTPHSDANHTGTANTTANGTVQQKQPDPLKVPTGNQEMGPRVRLTLAKSVINFLKDPESKVLEFWQIWSESIPPRDDLQAGMAIEFSVATSADMQKLTWRTSGPQNIFIQKMVDFFWNVGAPESEIDRLNDVGARINPFKIGSWIDMSAKGGMDGGWFFPVDVPFKVGIDACDSGPSVTTLMEWVESKGVTDIFAVGRDMGAAPPRQTELKFKIPGPNFDEQLKNGLDAFNVFGFPAIPDGALKILRESKTEQGLSLSVISSSEGFVRLGLLVPRPATETVLSLCSISGGNHDELAAFEASLGKDGPSYVEYQYLMKGFGYGVYKEGFDIVFHYDVGSEINS